MALTPAQEQAIIGIRTAQGWGPDRIALVLRLPGPIVHRAGPGDLVHIDTKKLGRIIGGSGHRDTG